jgi:hypothetical protein
LLGPASGLGPSLDAAASNRDAALCTAVDENGTCSAGPECLIPTGSYLVVFETSGDAAEVRTEAMGTEDVILAASGVFTEVVGLQIIETNLIILLQLPRRSLANYDNRIRLVSDNNFVVRTRKNPDDFDRGGNNSNRSKECNFRQARDACICARSTEEACG